jgi:hypothetical protein
MAVMIILDSIVVAVRVDGNAVRVILHDDRSVGVLDLLLICGFLWQT